MFGCCRRQELTDLKFSDVKYYSDCHRITIPTTTTTKKLPRIFFVPEEYYLTVKKYISPRPPSKKPDDCF